MQTRRVVLVVLLFFGGLVLAAHAYSDFVADPGQAAYSAFGRASSGFNNAPGRFDRNADGRIDLIVVDRNGDGSGDYWATDRNFDGLTDDYQYDRNFDGRIDQWEYDNDHDGIPEKIFIDGDGNGKSELYAELNPLTRAYTWYGDLQGVQASGEGPSKLVLKRGKRMARGKAADSL